MPFGKVRTPIECEDGFTMSVQASNSHYCFPRNSEGPYAQVEVGFPSIREEALMPFSDGEDDDPTEMVYGYVPVWVVAAIIVRHGGIVSGELPPFAGFVEPVATESEPKSDPICARFSMMEFD